MESVSEFETARCALKAKFGPSCSEFVDVFLKPMMGSQTDRVIDASPMFKFMGETKKGNLKIKMDTLKIEYETKPRGKTHELLISVDQMKTLLRLKKNLPNLAMYESMEKFLDDNNLRNLEATPIPAPNLADVPSTSANHKPDIESFTNNIDRHGAQFYFRKTDGDFTDVYPVGRPDKRLSPEELRAYTILKGGGQLNDTMRQGTHDKAFLHSVLLDSCITNASFFVERKVKDIWKNNNQLYEGLYRGKKTRDTELLLVQTQAEYNERVQLVQKMIVEAESSSDLQIEKERTKQEEERTKQEEERTKQEVARARIAESDRKARMAEARVAMMKLKLQKD